MKLLLENWRKYIKEEIDQIDAFELLKQLAKERTFPGLDPTMSIQIFADGIRNGTYPKPESVEDIEKIWNSVYTIFDPTHTLHAEDPEYDIFENWRKYLNEQSGQKLSFFRSEPIKTSERLQELIGSVGKEYPIFRKEGGEKYLGTYISPQRENSLQYITGLAGAGKAPLGVISTIEIDLSSWDKGDGGLDEAVFDSNIFVMPQIAMGTFKDIQTPKDDPMRIKQRIQALKKVFGPGVDKYLSSPLIKDAQTISKYYNPVENQKDMQTMADGGSLSRPPSDPYLANAFKVLEPLVEKMRKDPEIIDYFMKNETENIPRDFRMNSDSSGTKVLKVELFDGESGKPISSEDAEKKFQGETYETPA